MYKDVLPLASRCHRQVSPRIRLAVARQQPRQHAGRDPRIGYFDRLALQRGLIGGGELRCPILSTNANAGGWSHPNVPDGFAVAISMPLQIWRGGGGGVVHQKKNSPSFFTV